ncbi:NYN domain-containing protein (plasmid) [Herbiconiux sp. KACC 21604]|uniref:NYN domain-containing protein n=1 Tax=unclassified Herbiconiux TaxID=2618217 RepID=UPI0014912BEB|nr:MULTISPECIES: NYN domain-containing protein [unclassified Herbiconiux]QJU56248.1 NYN domain-containing protein [Herbiconiux sp. SALV-R1]WPO88862.1 NYN domain-containing protein [Herbiconiux sp. KACC 21604]
MTRHRKACTTSRALPTQHVIDLENLVAGRVSYSRTAEFFQRYRALVPIGPADDVVVGLSPSTAPEAAFALPERTRLRVGRWGRDSADQALLDAIDPDFTAAHFSRVVLCSGDHCFAPLVSALRAHKLDVVVVFVPLSISAKLYTTASDSLRFPALAA